MTHRPRNFDLQTCIAAALAPTVLAAVMCIQSERKAAPAWTPAEAPPTSRAAATQASAPEWNPVMATADERTLAQEPVAAVGGRVITTSTRESGSWQRNASNRDTSSNIASSQKRTLAGDSDKAKPFTAGTAGSSPARQGSYKVLMTVTGFCACTKCCGPRACGITASGAPVSTNSGHFVAASRSVPFGVLVCVPGYAGNRSVPVLDRGKAIKGNRLDLFLSTHKAALKWGRKTLTVEIVR